MIQVKKGGIIVRLIDVVLILLFGFISISEISRRSAIDLPKSDAVPVTNPQSDETLIIGIRRDGTYLVDNESRVIHSLDEMVAYLDQYLGTVNEGNLPRVKLLADWNAPIKYTIAVAHLCDERELPKGIEVIRKQE